MNPMPDMMLAGLKMIAALAVVLAMVFLLLYGVRKLASRRIGAGSTKRIQVLESHYMGVKKSVALVRVPGKILVLGLCQDRINLLDTLDDAPPDAAAPPADTVDHDAPVPFGPLLAGQMNTSPRRGQ